MNIVAPKCRRLHLASCLVPMGYQKGIMRADRTGAPHPHTHAAYHSSTHSPCLFGCISGRSDDHSIPFFDKVLICAFFVFGTIAYLDVGILACDRVFCIQSLCIRNLLNEGVSRGFLRSTAILARYPMSILVAV